MELLNPGTRELGLLALAFAVLQLVWIGSMIRRRCLARPLSEPEFRRHLERIWARR
jgi:hypothetical protein